MTPIFADTSYFIALLDDDDDFHANAILVSQMKHRLLVTTSAIILELGSFYHDASAHFTFLSILDALKTHHAIILHVDAPLQQRAVELFSQRQDKNWSLTDCISFLVMEDRLIHEAATSDRHFEEAGFIALLRQPLKK